MSKLGTDVQINSRRDLKFQNELRRQRLNVTKILDALMLLSSSNTASATYGFCALMKSIMLVTPAMSIRICLIGADGCKAGIKCGFQYSKGWFPFTSA